MHPCDLYQLVFLYACQDAVRLPQGEDVNDWICANAVDFYNELSLLYASMEGHCTAERAGCRCTI